MGIGNGISSEVVEISRDMHWLEIQRLIVQFQPKLTMAQVHRYHKSHRLPTTLECYEELIPHLCRILCKKDYLMRLNSDSNVIVFFAAEIA